MAWSPHRDELLVTGGCHLCPCCCCSCWCWWLLLAACRRLCCACMVLPHRAGLLHFCLAAGTPGPHFSALVCCLHAASRPPPPPARDDPLSLQGGCHRRGAAPPAACLMLAGPRRPRCGRMPPREALVIVTQRPLGCPPLFLFSTCAAAQLPSPAHPHPAAAPAAAPPAGAADGTLRVWDRRKASAPALSLHHHTQAATVVEWCPQQAGVFASAGEDRCGRGKGGEKGALCATPALPLFGGQQALLLLHPLRHPSAPPPIPAARGSSLPSPQAAVRVGPRSQGAGLRSGRGGRARRQAAALSGASPNAVPACWPPGERH